MSETECAGCVSALMLAQKHRDEYVPCELCGTEWFAAHLAPAKREVAASVALGALARTLELFVGRGVAIEPDHVAGTGGEGEITQADARRQRDIRLADRVAIPKLETMLAAGQRRSVVALWWAHVYTGPEVRALWKPGEEHERIGCLLPTSREQLAGWIAQKGPGRLGARLHGEAVITAANAHWSAAQPAYRAGMVRRPWMSEIVDAIAVGVRTERAMRRSIVQGNGVQRATVGARERS